MRTKSFKLHAPNFNWRDSVDNPIDWEFVNYENFKPYTHSLSTEEQLYQTATEVVPRIVVLKYIGL